MLLTCEKNNYVSSDWKKHQTSRIVSPKLLGEWIVFLNNGLFLDLWLRELAIERPDNDVDMSASHLAPILAEHDL